MKLTIHLHRVPGWNYTYAPSLSAEAVNSMLRKVFGPEKEQVASGCSLTLREERRLRVFENRVLRRVFRPKRDEVTGEWGKLHNEELTQYCAGGKIEKNEMGGALGTYGGGERCAQGSSGET